MSFKVFFNKFSLFFCRFKSFCRALWECMTYVTLVTLLSFFLTKSWHPKPVEMGGKRREGGGLWRDEMSLFLDTVAFKNLGAESPKWSHTGTFSYLIRGWVVLFLRLISSFLLCFITIWNIIVERQWPNLRETLDLDICDPGQSNYVKPRSTYKIGQIIFIPHGIIMNIYVKLLGHQ